MDGNLIGGENMNKFINLWFATFCCILLHFSSCTDNADMNEPIGSKIAPAQVLNVTVKNEPGSAIIYYDLPDDQNLKYVRASYMVDNIERQVNASFYTDSLIVDGFPEEGEYEVKLYSVSYGETVSEPLSVIVNPLNPPYKEVRSTLQASRTFGGIRINWDGNTKKSDLAIGVLRKEGDDIWSQIDMYYTESEKGVFYVYGLEAITTDFGIFVRDRWGHLSDTLYVTETPLYEEECDKSLFRKMMLPTDTYECHTWSTATQGNDMTRLWDGITDADPCFQTKTNSNMPQWFTFDLGRNYKLSRFIMVSRYYPNKYGNTFQKGHPKIFEIWGSNNPNPDGSFDDSWTLLSEYESVKPSGGGVNDPLTAEDQEVAKNGENFSIPDSAPAVRYIRFLTKETWGKTRFMHLHELTFFGAPDNNE